MSQPNPLAHLVYYCLSGGWYDKDGTLVAGVPKADGKTRPANKPEEQILLPGVARKICQLRSQGHLIAIASNQGGCAWGVMTTNEAELLMKDCADKIGGVNAMIYSPYDPKAAGTPRADARYAIDHENRKPKPGMITHIMRVLEIHNGDPMLPTWYEKMPVVFVGDQESDRQAAAAAGVEFVWAQDFFCYE